MVVCICAFMHDREAVAAPPHPARLPDVVRQDVLVRFGRCRREVLALLVRVARHLGGRKRDACKSLVRRPSDDAGAGALRSRVCRSALVRCARAGPRGGRGRCFPGPLPLPLPLGLVLFPRRLVPLHHGLFYLLVLPSLLLQLLPRAQVVVVDRHAEDLLRLGLSYHVAVEVLHQRARIDRLGPRFVRHLEPDDRGRRCAWRRKRKEWAAARVRGQRHRRSMAWRAASVGLGRIGPLFALALGGALPAVFSSRAAAGSGVRRLAGPRSAVLAMLARSLGLRP